MNKTFDIAVGPWDKPSVETVHRRPVLRAVFEGEKLSQFVVHWQCMDKDKKKTWYSDGSYNDAYERALADFNHRCREVVKRGPCSLAELEDLHGHA